MKVENLKNKIKMLNVEDLIPYFNNPKEHPEKQIDLIASSIKNFGFVQPIVVDKDNEIIIGHGRLLALKKLNIEQVPVLVKDDLSEAEIKAMRIADNKVAESNWNMSALSVELEELMDSMGDIEELINTGFSEEELDIMLNVDEDFSFGDMEDYDDEDPADMVMQEGEKPNQAYVVTISFSDMEFVENFLERINMLELADRYSGNTRNISVDGDGIVYD